MAKNPERPTCLAIILCDDIYRDIQTKKMVIVGTFNEIKSQKYPAKHGRLKILFTLTDAKGEYDISLAIENARTGNEILRLDGKATLKDPLQIADFDVGIMNLFLPEAGKYWVTLKVDGELITQRPFNAGLMDGKDKSQQ